MTLPFDEVRLHVEAAKAELQSLTEQLYAGKINLQQWEASAAGIIKDAHLANSAWAVGADNMTSVEFGRCGGNLAHEFNFLSNFANDIADGNVSEAQAIARLSQYGNASQQAYWSEFGRQVDAPSNLPILNQVPCDGGTSCRGNCTCSLVVNADGSIDWALGATTEDHCDDCPSLAAGGPYRPGNL